MYFPNNPKDFLSKHQESHILINLIQLLYVQHSIPKGQYHMTCLSKGAWKSLPFRTHRALHYSINQCN